MAVPWYTSTYCAARYRSNWHKSDRANIYHIPPKWLPGMGRTFGVRDVNRKFPRKWHGGTTRALHNDSWAWAERSISGAYMGNSLGNGVGAPLAPSKTAPRHGPFDLWAEHLVFGTYNYMQFPRPWHGGTTGALKNAIGSDVGAPLVSSRTVHGGELNIWSSPLIYGVP